MQSTSNCQTQSSPLRWPPCGSVTHFTANWRWKTVRSSAEKCSEFYFRPLPLMQYRERERERKRKKALSQQDARRKKFIIEKVDISWLIDCSRFATLLSPEREKSRGGEGGKKCNSFIDFEVEKLAKCISFTACVRAASSHGLLFPVWFFSALFPLLIPLWERRKANNERCLEVESFVIKLVECFEHSLIEN